MAPRQLLHLTSSLESLASILEWGVLFTYNQTEVLEALLGTAFEHVSAQAPGGMVCFTELPYEDAKNALASGKYGVAVETGWAIGAGARPVEYVDPANEATFSAFRDSELTVLKNSFPNEIKNSETLARWLTELAATNPNFAKSFGLEDKFHQLQLQALWMQTIGHEQEREWRLRSSQGYPNIEVIQDRKQQVEMLLRMVKNIPSTRHLLALQIPQDAVLGLYAPQGRLAAAKELAEKFGYDEGIVNSE